MAKPKSPLLSLGARGSIGDTLTFQKRGRLTIARQKPIPTDPHTDLQLAQRQVYREAVACWNTLTTEAKETYRGLYPGLTPYQCYMKTALKYVEPEPPPEEQTEEQTDYDTPASLRTGQYYKQGQKLMIPNREVTKLGFWLSKLGLPTGDVIFAIRKVIDDSLIVSKVLGDAAALTADATYYELTFDAPVIINEEVRIYTEFDNGASGNYVQQWYQNADVKPDELRTLYKTSWVDSGTSDAAYRYKYYEV